MDRQREYFDTETWLRSWSDEQESYGSRNKGCDGWYTDWTKYHYDYSEYEIYSNAKNVYTGDIVSSIRIGTKTYTTTTTTTGTNFKPFTAEEWYNENRNVLSRYDELPEYTPPKAYSTIKGTTVNTKSSTEYFSVDRIKANILESVPPYIQDRYYIDKEISGIPNLGMISEETYNPLKYLANCREAVHDQGTCNPDLDDDAEMSTAEFTADVIKNLGLGIAASIVKDGLDSVNTVQSVLLSIFGESAITNSYNSISHKKQDVVAWLEGMKTNDIAYYAGRTLTDAVLTVVGVAGVIGGVQTIISGLAGDLASGIVEGLSFGTGTPVVALTAAVSTVIAAVGAAEAGFSFALATNAFTNGLDNAGKFKNAVSTGGGYYRWNFRSNLKKHIGNPPSSTANPEAHHVLPQKFVDWFSSKGINIHDPKFGSWVDKDIHLKWSYEYNLKWENFKTRNLGASVNEIMDFARFLASKYGFQVHF